MCQAQTTAVLFSGQERHYRGDEETVGILDRLLLAWRVLFPDRKASPRQIGSNALVAKERLRMILISDRCSVNDLAKKKIMDNIVGALADFVVIESEEKIQLNVSLDPDLGAVYAVTVPIRRVKPEYQSHSKVLQDVDLHEAIVDESERPFQSVTTLNSQSV
ncbi:hypothetical protein O6H91_06G046500 [Diphasiastrum complanatum]|uniref:Uncharacterized protein n=1 Tax=Diphasiastrum complanatum TaxID=34168 RepID=A0ACC2DDI0_DIPCM|nr:hypothetical protein O6H91_06G046500 [Diphasiastrum complanatum]